MRHVCVQILRHCNTCGKLHPMGVHQRSPPLMSLNALGDYGTSAKQVVSTRQYRHCLIHCSMPWQLTGVLAMEYLLPVLSRFRMGMIPGLYTKCWLGLIAR